MTGWYKLDFRAKRTAAAGIAEPRHREPPAGREMVSGLVSWCLHLAIKDRAATRKMAAYKLVSEMGLGASTSERMRKCKPIAQTTALKIVTFLGTSVRAVLTKYQHEKK